MTFRAGYGAAIDDPGRVERAGFPDFDTAHSWLFAQIQELDALTAGHTWWPFTAEGIRGLTKPFKFRNPARTVAYVLEEGNDG